MNREAQNILLLMVGLAIGRTALDGTYVRYVKPGLFPYLLLSAAVVIGLAVVAIIRDVRNGGPSDTHSSRSFWALLLPAAMILLVVPPALGIRTVPIANLEQEQHAPERRAFPQLPDDGIPNLRMTEVVQRAVRDTAKTLDDREIRVSGFIVATDDGGSPRLDGSRSGFDLARIRIICCAADARTIRIHLNSSVVLPSPGEWVEIRGVVVPGSAVPITRYLPTMNVVDVQPIPPPVNSYEY